MKNRAFNRFSAALSLLLVAQLTTSSAADSPKPLPSMREQAEIQQQWLKLRLERVLPRLMRKHGVQMWLVICREYNEAFVFPPIDVKRFDAGDVPGTCETGKSLAYMLAYVVLAEGQV